MRAERRNEVVHRAAGSCARRLRFRPLDAHAERQNEAFQRAPERESVTIEQSHGKARTTLPRSGDLRLVQADVKPTGQRGPGGRFAAGNRVGLGAREKNAVRRLLGREVGDEAALAVARDAARLFSALLRDMPSDAANVRQLVALQARHTALASFFGARAAELGIESEQGMAADERAMRHGQRAERLAVTSLDIATKLATKRKPSDLGPAPWLEPPEEPAT
jgi:hypothetical protein